MKRREFLSMSAVLAASGILAGCAASNAGSTSTAASTAGSTAASEVPSNGGETIKIICPYGVGGTADIDRWQTRPRRSTTSSWRT